VIDDPAAPSVPATTSEDAPAQQLSVKEAIAAKRAELAGAIADGTASGASAEAEELVRELAAQGRTPEQIAQNLRARGMFSSVVSAGSSVGTAADVVKRILDAKPADAAPGADEAPNPLLVTVDDGVEIELPDAETAAAARQSMLRTSEYREAMAAVAAHDAELQAFHDVFATDPVSVVVPRLAESPQLAVDLARHLLALPGVRAAVEADPREDTELLASLGQRQRQGTAQLARIGAAREYRDTVAAAVDRVIQGTTLSGDALELARTDFVRDIAAHVRANGNRPIPLAVLPQLLQARAAQYGLDPNAVAVAFTSTAPPRPRTARAADVEEARATGPKLAAASRSRREAAAVPGAGAGARPARVELPTNQTVSQRIASLKKMFLGR
jgi:hypothetical protein